MTTPLRLLIVEDSEDDALLLERELTKNGYDLDCQRVDTLEALQSALAANKWDIVISDLIMRRFSGLDALRIYKESGIDIPFIIVSGKIGEDTAVEAMRVGAHDYILKGNLARLAPAIKRELADAEVRCKRKLAEEESHKMKQQFQQAQKLESLGALAGGIAHDFNNILTVIMGHCSMVAKAIIDLEPSVLQHIQQIEIASKRAAELCRQLLTYAGKSPLVQTEVNICLLTDETVKMLQSSLKMNVTIEPDLKCDLPEFIGDKTQIQQLVMNLILNAAEAIGDNNGTIRIGLSKKVIQTGQYELDYRGSAILPGGYACLEVSDNGCGMDEATQKRIFEPFFTTKYRGRGLGMSAILGIIKSHACVLKLSSAPGVGTTFSICFPLPVVAAVAQTVPVPRPDHDVKACRTILLVDDEELLRAVGASMLYSLGFTVITASNGREALKIYRERASETELVMLDLFMPEMDGLAAYHELRKINATLPVLIGSGYNVEEVSDVIINDEYTGFIQKPYMLEELQDVLIKLLGAM